jgi:thymidylate synthase ThyX
MMWPADWSGTWKDKLRTYTEEGNKLYHESLEYFTPILGRKRAKESARFFKTFNSQISMDIMFNWRSFYHFQKLRNSPDAQKEVRELAEEMLNQVKNIEGNPFEKTIKAFEL